MSGDVGGKHGGQAGKRSSIRVPLIFDGPGFRGPQEVPELVGLIDVAPTLLEAAGVPVPAEWKGRSAIENRVA